MRTNWAVIHWNENVDRAFTSVWSAPANNAQGQVQKKNLVPCTYRYRNTVWDLLVSPMYA